MPKKIKIVHVGRLIDGTGNSIQKNLVLTIKNGMIDAINPFEESFKKYITHNFSNHTIYPPLVDAHVHLAMSGTLNMESRRAQLAMNFKQAKHQILNHLKQYSKAGITTIRDAGDHFGHTYKFKKICNASFNIDILSPKIAWYRTGRYGKFAGKSIDLTDNCLETISSQHQGNHIKIIQSGINSLNQPGKETLPQFSVDEMKSICKWACQRNIPVMVHANGAQPVSIAIDAGCTSIEHGYFMGEDNLKKMAEKQIFWVPTLIPMYELAKNLTNNKEKEIAQRTFDLQCEQIQKANKFGVKIVPGSDAGSFGVRHAKGLLDEMKQMVVCGFSLSKVIQCCTSQSLKLLNCSSSGFLKKGEVARFVAVPTLSDNIFKNGQEVLNFFF